MILVCREIWLRTIETEKKVFDGSVLLKVYYNLGAHNRSPQSAGRERSHMDAMHAAKDESGSSSTSVAGNTQFVPSGASNGSLSCLIDSSVLDVLNAEVFKVDFELYSVPLFVFIDDQSLR